MRMVDIIIKKRDGYQLSNEEIKFFIDGVVNETIPDYQTSAFLMAVYYQGMTDDELSYFTDCMLHSGEVVDLSEIKGVTCDKHSTGGVGDKTSLVVAPICAACGVKMAKMSGRGLGHTGGTLDKIESIPGATISLPIDEFTKMVNEIGLAIIGQTKNVAPADKILYALRDVTGTVNSIPLIASSIMSKKLAAGADNIVLDVKVGKGAFMEDVDSATKLAETMVRLGKAAGKNTVATLTDMNEPLGDCIGNSLEVMEAIETLKGNVDNDFSKLCIALSAEVLTVCGIVSNNSDAVNKVKEVIKSGEALEKLRLMIIYQHGNPEIINDYSLFVDQDGVKQMDLCYHGEQAYIKEIDALKIGEAAMFLGAGRATKDEDVDHGVGIIMKRKVGSIVNDGDVLLTLYYREKGLDDAINLVNKAIVYTMEQVLPINKIIKVVD